MRGLDIRVNMALERVHAVINPDAPDGEDELICLLHEARALGSYDAHRGFNDPPMMFLGEVELADWWSDGYNSAFGLAEMMSCPECNDGTGNPCRIHG